VDGHDQVSLTRPSGRCPFCVTDGCLVVNVEAGLFYCFGCGRYGQSLRLVEEGIPSPTNGGA